MKRSELEHVIRAAGAIAGAKELIIIGSQAILSSYPNAPDELTISMEADVYPLNDPETACFPVDWRERAVKVSNNNTGGVTGICLSPVDLAVSKIAAGRDKDFAFVATMLKNNMISFDELERLIFFLPETRNKTVKQNFDIFRNTSMPAEL